MRVALVVNPTSGRRKGEDISRNATAGLVGAGHEVVEVRGDTGHDVCRALEHLLNGSPFDTVAVVGGDGALHDILPALVDHDVAVAMIPAGTGNDIARHLGVDNPERAVAALLAGHRRAIDLIEVSGAPGESVRYVATVVASGFDSKVNERANTMTWPRGAMRYNRAILAELRTFKPLRFTLTADGHDLEREAMLVAVANMPSFGGGLRIAEGASAEDGTLDVIVIHPVSTLRLMRVFPMLYRGTHVDLPEFERIRAHEVTWSSPGIVAYGDGERLGSLPRTARVLPGALTMVVGER